MPPTRKVRSLVAALTLCLACIPLPRAETSAGASQLKSGIDLAAFDTSVTPGQDFFQYCNGGWIKAHPIPPEHSAWGVSEEMAERNLAFQREILDGLGAARAPLDDDSRKVRDLYLTAMDEARLQRDGASPLKDEFERIAKISAIDDLLLLVAHHHVIGSGPLFSFFVEQDEKTSSRYAIHLYQGGTALPERDYYLGNDDDSKRIRTQYREHVARTFALLGDKPEAASAEADVVLALETKLAEASRPMEALRDTEKQYNKKTPAELAKLAPLVRWDAYLKAVGIDRAEDVIVGQPEFFARVNELLGTVPIEQWKTYLRWNLIHSVSNQLSDPFVDEHFRFWGQVMRGAKEIQPRWKRSLHSVDELIGEALGRLYVEKRFGPEARARADAMVENIVAAYRERIQTRDWMGADTKKQALAKLERVARKIGYPQKWRDYSALDVRPDSYVLNVLRGREFEFHRVTSRLGKPVDRGEWGMTPPTVNAYYNASLNEIVFPAGILQPPYFDPAADDAFNYGSIGATIGHELSHGFDDQGCLFDAEGNLKNWWTPDDKSRFDAKAARLVKQFDACKAIDDLHVNGKLTLGENIADLGGLTVALAAYHRSLKGQPAPVLDGFTGDQRFFIGYGQSWCEALRPEELKSRLRSDFHSPENFRVLVPVSNVPEFYEAFKIKAGDAMYRPPGERVEVW